MPSIDSVGAFAGGSPATMDSLPAAEPVQSTDSGTSPSDVPESVTQHVQDLNSAVTKTKHAILSGMLSGDVGVAAAIGNLVVAAAIIERLIATLPPNLGVQIDVGA
jgi:hypothetical protein